MILGWKIFEFLNSGVSFNMSLQGLGDYLRENLAEVKEEGLISTCGCEGFFRLDEMDYGYDVYMEVMNMMTKFVISLDPKYLGGGPNCDVKFEIINRQDVIEGYGEIELVEYVDESPTLTEKDIEEYLLNNKR
tara:strand:- start:1071 stop:1469 length:399 start_codon:yes stop_codon:yes gene_type:complete